MLKVKDGILGRINEIRDDGMSYNDIGIELGLSTMTVYMACSGETKNAN